MSQVNNPTQLSKLRPSNWSSFSEARYLRDIEEFCRQVYQRITGIVKVPVYTVANLPSASDFDPTESGEAAMVYVSDESGGAVLAFSDGTNWRRVTDRAVVS